MWKFGWVSYAWWITAQPRTRSSRRAQTQHWMFEEMCSVSLEYCDCGKAVWCTCRHLAAIIMLVFFLSFLGLWKDAYTLIPAFTAKSILSSPEMNIMLENVQTYGLSVAIGMSPASVLRAHLIAAICICVQDLHMFIKLFTQNARLLIIFWFP